MHSRIKIGIFFTACLAFFGGISFGSSGTVLSGSLLDQISVKKTMVENLYTQSYQQVYQKFKTSVVGILKSLNYQSLVCLGVMNDTIFLQQMQTDSKNLKLGFLNAYTAIEADALDIEQKHRIDQDSAVSLFASGTSYETEKLKILTDLQNLVTSHQQLAQQFKQSYETKIASFINDVTIYTEKNKQIISGIVEKMNALQSLDQEFTDITSRIAFLQSKLSGPGNLFFSQIDHLKNTSLDALNMSLQSLIDAQVKRYKVLPSLSGELLTQKFYALSLFDMQFDERVNLLLAQRYDNKEYSAIKTQLDKIKQTYMSSGVYQCQKFITSSSFDADIHSLSQKMQLFLSSINQGISSGTTFSVSGNNFQKTGFTWFSTISQQQKDTVNLFNQTIKQKITTLLDRLRSSSQTKSSSGTIDVQSLEKSVQFVYSKPSFVFTSAFKRNQKHPDIIVLQQLLASLHYYTGTIDGIYSAKTIQAVYQFQLANNLLKGYEHKPQTRGWMGPSTRVKLNELIKK